MYQPEKYKNDDPQFIYNFISQFPFATLVLQGNNLLATHVPILVDGSHQNFRMYAHIANHNPMRQFLETAAEMLVIFKGPDAYTSSSWYEKPDIPTWDYSAVHINAKVILQNDAELQDSLEKLLRHFEKNMDQPIDRKRIPKRTWNENFKEITGFWLQPEKCVGIEKLHQGFSQKDINNILAHLATHEACPMQNLRKQISDKNLEL